jgi:histidyl-tRNA synthetase
MAGIAGLTRKLAVYLPEESLKDIDAAYRYSEKAHFGQLRASGRPYIQHPLTVADILADWRFDAQSIIAALLHDVVEDTAVSLKQVREAFGGTVAHLVDGLSKIERIEGIDRRVQEAEQIIMLAQLWNDMGVQDKLCLVVNNLGTADERAHHREKLRTHFRHHESQLDDAARARIDGNPLRILDSKNKSVQEVVNTAPLLANELGTASQQHVASVKNMITGAGIDFVEDTTLVRGLDYYNLTVFEWVLKDDSRRQSTLCGGGRYDGLSEQIGGPALPGCGFALGLDRLAALVDKASHPAPTCYLVTTGGSDSYCTTVAEQLRKNGLSVWRHVGGGNLARQLKKADAMNTALAVIVGTDEESAGEVTLKRLCDGEQQQVLTSRVAETAAMMMIQTG